MDTGARVRYQKVSEQSGEELETDEIELGFEVKKGTYVTFDREELKALQPAATKAVEVTDFVALADIDPIYYERTYWLAPADDRAKSAYQLLLAAMEDRGLVAVGSVVMRNKQYLTAVRPLDGALAMSTMRFADEVVPRKDVEGVPARRAKPDAKLLRMAQQLIDSLATDWKPNQYRDTYTEELRKRIAAKEAGKEIVEDAPAPSSAKVVDLMEALSASVEAAKSKSKGKGTSSGRRSSSSPKRKRSA